MKKVSKIFCASVILLSLSAFSAFCQKSEKSVAGAAFVQGASAFKAGEWMSAVFMLRRAVSYAENYNAETFYMLITAEMYGGEYKTAYQDAETFLQNFPESPYVSYVSYHRGRALFCLGEYERSVLALSDFCHDYPDHEMYASALFWIAESFFAGYNYEDADILYTRIVSEFSDDAKAPAAQYRIETIAQNAREEKLLYLLKETGEEYLAAKEEYERQLKLSGAASTMDVRKRVLELQHKNSDLQKTIADKEQEVYVLQVELDTERTKNKDIKAENENMINELKIKAQKTQDLLNSNRAKGAR